MIIFVAGMPRSGSTFSLNIAREILQRSGTVHQEFSCSLLKIVQTANKCDHLLWKSHAADELSIRLVEQGAARVVCTFRKPEDAIASAIRAFEVTLDNAIVIMRQWLEMLVRIRRFALLIPYEQIDHYPWITALRIARYLEDDLSYAMALSLARRYSKKAMKELADALKPDDPQIVKADTTWYDAVTFLHRRHISDLISRPAMQLLGEKSVMTIRERLAGFTAPDGEIDWNKIACLCGETAGNTHKFASSISPR